MRYVFLIAMNSGHEERVGFFATSEEDARRQAVEWACEHGTVGDCVEKWGSH